MDGSCEALVQQVQVDDKLQVQGGGVPELGEEQVQVVWALDDMHRSLVQVDGTLQVLQVDVQVQADVAQVLELVGVEQVVGKGQVEVEDEGEV